MKENDDTPWELFNPHLLWLHQLLELQQQGRTEDKKRSNDDDLINGLKAGMVGLLAGIGDSV